MLAQNNPYRQQVALLLEVLPLVGRERCFALKGGTAINLFVREPAVLGVSAAVEESFGYVEVPVVHKHDLYAGKLCAALDRQHPRDLFDVRLLLENEGMETGLLEVLVVYLLSSDRPLSELLSPNRKPLAATFENEFVGMTLIPVTLAELEQTRETMIGLIRERLTAGQRQFLLSFKQGEPDWALLNLPGVADLPAVQWKLLNIKRMTAAKRAQALECLREALLG